MFTQILSKLIVAFVLCLILGGIFLGIQGCMFVAKETREQGVKNLLIELWEGPQE